MTVKVRNMLKEKYSQISCGKVTIMVRARHLKSFALCTFFLSSIDTQHTTFGKGSVSIFRIASSKPHITRYNLYDATTRKL